jgi:hypothetical protein
MLSNYTNTIYEHVQYGPMALGALEVSEEEQGEPKGKQGQ